MKDIKAKSVRIKDKISILLLFIWEKMKYFFYTIVKFYRSQLLASGGLYVSIYLYISVRRKNVAGTCYLLKKGL